MESYTVVIVFALRGAVRCVFRAGFVAGDKVTYDGAEFLCHGCVVAAAAAGGDPERPTHVSPVQSVATRPQGIPVGDQLHSPDSDFSTSGKHAPVLYRLHFVIHSAKEVMISPPSHSPFVCLSVCRIAQKLLVKSL